MKKLKTFYMIGWGLWAMATVSCVMGCSDDGEGGLPGTEGGKPDEEEYLDTDSMNYERVKSSLFVADTLPPGAVKYTPRSGEVLDNAFPDVYSIGVDSVEEALSFFNTNCVPVGEEGKVVSEDGALVYDLGDYGRLVYRTGDGRDEVASVEVRLTGVDGVSRISFIPMSQWPNNAESQFLVGDIVKDKSGAYWICVRACRGGLPGILMTFERGTEIWLREDHYKTYTKVTGCASMDAWNALAQFYYSNPGKFRALYEELKRKGVSHGMLYRALEDLYTDSGRTHQVGDTWDNNYFWVSRVRKVWEASTDYVIVSGSTIILKDGMPVFKSRNYHFKGDQMPEVPQFRDSHSETFAYNDNLEDKYIRVYPES